MASVISSLLLGFFFRMYFFFSITTGSFVFSGFLAVAEAVIFHGFLGVFSAFGH